MVEENSQKKQEETSPGGIICVFCGFESSFQFYLKQY